MFTVMLDPGHGGEDPGAMAGGICEKDINLLVATKVYQNSGGDLTIRQIDGRSILFSAVYIGSGV